MKKLFSILTLTTVAALLATTWSCKPKNTDVAAVAQVTATGIADPEFPATSLGIKLNLASIESYVYVVEEGENKPAPDADIAFTEGVKHAAKDGELSTYIYGVEGSKTYTIHFVFKVLGQNRFLTQSISSKSGAYTRLINIVSAERFEIKVHFNVPEGQHFRYVITDKASINSFSDDLTRLQRGVRAQGPQVISYRDGGPTGFKDPETNEDMLALVKPGGVFSIKMTYCDENGDVAFTMNEGPVAPLSYASSNKPMESGYTTECDQDYYSFDDPYARIEVITAQPAVGEGAFAVESHITELSAIFRITPPASVKRYGAVMMPIAAYEEQVAVFGEYGVMEYMQRQLKPITGVQQISNLDPLEKDVDYLLFLIGQCDETGETQIRNIVEFKALVSNKPVPKIVITELTDASDGPYQVRFNVKAPNKDLFAAKYILNYVKEIEPVLGSGGDYDLIMLQYGQPMKDDLIAQINSDGGLTLPFDSFEDMENRIIISAYNEDEKYEIVYADSRSAAEPAKTKVNSGLFTSLLGTWEVKAKFHYFGQEDMLESTFNTTITAEPEAAAPTFVERDSIYEVVLNYYIFQEELHGTPEAERRPNAVKALTVELEKYKIAQPKFAKKYSDQNRLVLNGFKYNENGWGLDYFSSWDLFCHTSYSSYDVDQLFFDYGPKLFLEVRDGDKLTLETNRMFIAPFTYYRAHTVAGGFADNTAAYGQFPVTVVDADSLVIKNETIVENRKYPFAMISGSNGMGEVIFDADITMKRVTDQDAIVGKNARKAPYTFNRAMQTKADDKAVKRTKIYHRDAKSVKKPIDPTAASIAIPMFTGSAK